VRGAFLLINLKLKAPALIHGDDSHEKWNKETSLDICTGSRPKIDGAQENFGGKNSQKVEAI